MSRFPLPIRRKRETEGDKKGERGVEEEKGRKSGKAEREKGKGGQNLFTANESLQN